MESWTLVGGMLTRRCTGCHQAKTIRGVWYLLHGDAFVCETCMTHRPQTPVSARA